MNYMKYIYIYIYIINGKVQSSYIQCISKEIKEPTIKITFYIFSNSNRLNSTSYICTSFLYNISENKTPSNQYQIIILKTKLLHYSKKITQLEKHFISPCFVLLKFINSKGTVMVMLLTPLQMWIKLNQYYHMMVQ